MTSISEMFIMTGFLHCGRLVIYNSPCYYKKAMDPINIDFFTFLSSSGCRKGVHAFCHSRCTYGGLLSNHDHWHVQNVIVLVESPTKTPIFTFWYSKIS